MYTHTLLKAVYTLLFFLSFPLSAAEKLPKGILVLDGKTAPVLSLENLDGDPWQLKAFRGRWVFVHFWASWCGPCRKEMPTITSLFQKVDKNRLEIVLINTSEDEDTVFTFLASVAPDMTPLMDSDGSVTEVWQPRGLPATFFIDPEGNKRYLALGGRDWSSAPYLNFVQELIKQ